MYELGYDLLIAHTLNKPDREELCLRRMLSRRVDGLFVTPVYRFEAEARIYQEITARKTPTVLLRTARAVLQKLSQCRDRRAGRQLQHDQTSARSGPPEDRLFYRAA